MNSQLNLQLEYSVKTQPSRTRRRASIDEYACDCVIELGQRQPDT